MKLKINKVKMKAGFDVVDRISSRSNSLPILKNALLKTEKSFLVFSSTDLEVGVRWWELSKIEAPGEVVVSPGTLLGVIGLLPEDQVSLSVSKGNLLVDCGDCKTQVNGLSSDDFPIIPDIEGKDFVMIDAREFCKGISQVVDIPIFSTTRPEVSGVFFIFKDKSLKIVATDSHRLGEKTINIDSFTQEEFSFILPQKAAKEIVNIFGDKEGEIKMLFGSNQILIESEMPELKHPQVQLISRLVDGDYPNYEEIIPQKSEMRIILNRGEFLNQLKAAGVFSGKASEVKIRILPEKKGLEIFSESSDVGEYKSFLSGDVRSKKEEISFNCKYLIDGLANIKSEEVVFELNGPSAPGVIRPLKSSNFLYIVMPIKSS